MPGPTAIAHAWYLQDGVFPEDTGVLATMTFGYETRWPSPPNDPVPYESEDQQPGEVIHIFGACSTRNYLAYDALSNFVIPSDSKGGTYAQYAGSGIGSGNIGKAQSLYKTFVHGDPPPPYEDYTQQFVTLTLNPTWVRTSGPLLEVGDEIYVSWDVGSVYDPAGGLSTFQGIAVVMGFKDVEGLLIPQTLGDSPTIYPAMYTNKDSFPFPDTPIGDVSFNVSWEDDLGPEFVPRPEVTSLFIRAVAFRPDAVDIDDPTDFVATFGPPVGGFGYESSGFDVGLFIDCSLAGTGVSCEPGGEFFNINGVQGWVGNYQFLSLPGEPPPPPALGFSVSNRFNH